ANPNMAGAIRFYQQQNGLPATGKLDEDTYGKLVEQIGRADGAVQYTLTEADVRGPYMWIPANIYEQAALPCECYASALEMLDERFHTVTDVLRRLNPSVDFGALEAGMQLWVPNVEPFDAEHMAAPENSKAITKIVVDKGDRYLNALAADGSIVFHFPTTV